MRIDGRPPIAFYLLRPILNGLLRLLFKVRVEGLERLPQVPFVLISNHLSWVDPLLYLGICPPAPQLVFIGNAGTTSDNPFIRALTALAGEPLVPFRKRDGHSRAGALRTMMTQALLGKNVGFFPEGRVGVEGKMCPFHLGAFILATRLQRPIIPVGWSGGQRLYWRKRIHIRVGEPLWPEKGETPAELATRAHAAVRRIMPPYPGDLTKQRLTWLSTLFRIERHPFVFDGTQPLYGSGDPDGYDIPEDDTDTRMMKGKDS